MTNPPSSGLSTPPRCVDFERAYNFRDLGGYASSLGGSTRWNALYRSGALDSMTASDLSLYASLQIAAVVDLRNGDERGRSPDPVESVHIPVMSNVIKNRQLPDFKQFVERDHG